MIKSLHDNRIRTHVKKKSTVLLLIFLMFTIGAASAREKPSMQSIENVKISIQLKDASLQSAFIAIEKKTYFKFITSLERINRKKKVTVSVVDKSIKEILEIILKDTGLGFTQINSNIIISNIVSQTRQEPSQPGGAPVLMREIVGMVKDASNNPIPGVNVLVKGSTNGTSTSSEGTYSIAITSEPNAALIFSSIGFAHQEIEVGTKTIVDVTLVEDVKLLGEVLVSALGIEKDSKTVTYALQSIKQEEVNRTKEPNLINSLAGKVAGVVITRGTSPGSSSKILMRGNKSITGNNQPLFVIDGIPMNNANGAQVDALATFSGHDGGDAISNLNSEDIESMQILKGASAAALYGSQAANGVILITTKKGKEGTSSVTYSSSTTFENPILLPKLQTTYGQGFGGVSNTSVNDSWGPKITNGSDAHLKSFFQTGTTFVNSLSITNGNNRGQFYASYSNTTAKGIVPNDRYGRHNINVRGSTKLFYDKVTLDGSATYIQQIAKNRPVPGWQNSPIFGLYLFPTGDDFSKYSGSKFEVWNSTRNMYVQNWPYIRNEASSNQNPYWIQNRIQKDDERIRNIYTFSARWEILDWLELKARVNYDKIQDNFELRMYASSDPVVVGANGAYAKNPSTNNQLYSDILLSFNPQLNKNLYLTATLGFSNTQNKYASINLSTDGAATTLSFPNYFSTYALTGNFVHTESLQRRLSQALFGTATLGYKGKLFLDVTARNEWSSTVDQSFLYPSVGMSYILTESITPNSMLNYAKLRASYAEVGNALPFGVANWTPPYSVGPDGTINGRGSLPFFSGTDTLNLKPERTRSYEIGGEFRLFMDRLNVSLTYYDATTFNQVFQIAAPTGAGAANFWINGGTIKNKGFEGIVSYDVKIGNLSWTPSVNFSKNINQIRELSQLLPTDRFVLNSGFRISQLFLLRPDSPLLNGRKYGSYGDIFGRTYLRDANGRLRYDEKTGLPLKSASNDQYLGNANPSFLLGLSNAFRYKNWALNFLIDGRFGGEIISNTYQWLDFKGLSRRTAEARDNGGVVVNGKTIDSEVYYKYISGNADVAAAAEEYLYDITNVRLRELALSYSFPKFSRSIKDLNVSLVARNAFFLYNKAPFDPEINLSTENNLQGIDSFSVPSTRSFGASLKVTF